MTYFHYKKARRMRGQEVYAGQWLLGTLSVKADWRSRLVVRPDPVDLYCAVLASGDVLPGLYRSRHDAAEALFEAARHVA